eukprot:CAMPEP_0174876282 /NCGR_PEP_ID=MMETSP1114-20130205/79880_1 /TAXON_ID=312471 /ORGANISM="Neobodo designis, Strain CCAP 1951/1" /LENGTH=34 /DNA_ID= /DNA_START= /DNA_END= /DNA_ORIENTATION=
MSTDLYRAAHDGSAGDDDDGIGLSVATSVHDPDG